MYEAGYIVPKFNSIDEWITYHQSWVNSHGLPLPCTKKGTDECVAVMLPENWFRRSDESQERAIYLAVDMLDLEIPIE